MTKRSTDGIGDILGQGNRIEKPSFKLPPTVENEPAPEATQELPKKSHQKKQPKPELADAKPLEANEPSIALSENIPGDGNKPAEERQAVVAEETVEKREFGNVRVVDTYKEKERATRKTTLDRRILTHDLVLDRILNPEDENLDIVCITPKPALLPISLSNTVGNLDPFIYNGTNRMKRQLYNEDAKDYNPLRDLIRSRDRRSISVDGVGRGDGKDILQSRQELLAQKALMGELGGGL